MAYIKVWKRCTQPIDGASDGGDVCGKLTKHSTNLCLLHQRDALESEKAQMIQVLGELAGALRHFQDCACSCSECLTDKVYFKWPAVEALTKHKEILKKYEK